MKVSPAGPSLDRSGEPWRGVFPTLGAVRVYADGAIEVDVELDGRDDTEAPALREAALRYGWGEPLSWVRRGFRCASGTGVVPPDGRGCLILQGSVHDVAIVLVELVGTGWSVLGDRIVPTRWHDGELLAFPRAAPAIISQRRARRAGLEGQPVRADTDAVAVVVPRAHSAQPVRAFAEVGFRRPDETVLEELTGHDRFAAASLAMVGGVMSGVDEQSADSTPQETMRRHLALAALPFARLRFDGDSLGADVAELCRWWSVTASGAGPDAAEVAP